MKLFIDSLNYSVALFEYLFAMVAFVTFMSCKAVAQAPNDCTAPTIFSLCLENQEIYLKTCTAQDFTCLCKWNMAKLSCWDNCPSDPSRAIQAGVVESFCAIASANTPNVSLPSSTIALPAETSSSNNNNFVSITAGLIPTSSPSILSTSNVIGLQAPHLQIQIFAIMMIVCIFSGTFVVN